MANCYNQQHAVYVFFIGDIVSVGIPQEDRAKTDNKRLYAKIIGKLQPERHQLLTKYGVLGTLYAIKDLQPASSLMGLETEIPDAERETTITLAYAACQSSTTTRVPVSCTC